MVSLERRLYLSQENKIIFRTPAIAFGNEWLARRRAETTFMHEGHSYIHDASPCILHPRTMLKEVARKSLRLPQL